MKAAWIVRSSPLALLASLALAAPTAVLAAPEPATVPAAGSAASAPARTGVAAWRIDSAELEADPAVVFGTLPNGMRYAIQRNDTPKGEASVRFAIRVGAKDETDAQHGAAHFVEHMAFNGSKNIPEGKLLPMLERLGLAFGADTNAETALEHTIYKLDLPNTRTETVDAALLMMREVADGLTIAPAAVERERGIMLSEASVRNDANRRRIESYLRAAMPGNRAGDRVGAVSERIKGITAAQLREFYHGHYRPERATLVIAGDVDPASLQQRIESRFASWRGIGKPAADYSGPVGGGAATQVAAFVDPAVPEIIAFDRVGAYQPPANSLAEFRRLLAEQMAGQIIANRFQPIVLKENSPVLGAQFLQQTIARNARSFGLIVVARDGQWRSALALGEQELRRAHEHGFTQAEVDEVKANVLAALTNAQAQQASRRSAALAGALVSASLNNEVPTSPDFNLAGYRRIADTLTPASLAEAFRAAWQQAPSLVHVSTKTTIDAPEATIAGLLTESRRVAVAAPADKSAAAFAYDSFGTPGKVVADSTIADLGIRTIRFANGLQLNLKRTDWEPGRVAVTMKVGEGNRAFPADKPGLGVMSMILIPQDGFKAHDATELRRLLAGRDVALGLTTESDALIAGGVIPSGDLDLQLKLFGARLTATGYRPETRAQWAPVAQTVAAALAAQPIQVFQISQNYLLSGGDGRFGMPAPDALMALRFEDMQAQLERQLGGGAVSLALVGDFDPDAAIAAVGRTLGALAPRPARTAVVASDPAISFRPGGMVRLTHAGKDDQGLVSLAWPTTDGRDLKDSLTRDLLAAVMGLRATELVREKLGATYSPDATSFDQRTFRGFGHISLTATGGPESQDRIAAAFRQIAAEMRDRPVTADLLRRAREPIVAAYARGERLNGSWADLVADAQSDPDRLDRRRVRTATLQAITPAELHAAAKRYLIDAKAAEIRVVPQSAKP